RDSGVGAVFSQDVIRHVQETQLIHVPVIVTNNALERIHSGFLRRHATAHVLSNRMGACHLDVLFSATRSARGTDILVGVAAGPNNGRIATPSGELPRQTTGRGATGDVSFFVQRRAVDGASRG